MKRDAYCLEDINKISEEIRNYYLLSERPVRIMWGVFDTRTVAD